MPAFNQVILVGHLTKDVQLSYTASQTAVAEVGIAVNESWTGADGSKRQEVCFVDVTAFGKLAEILNKFCTKGSCVLIQGKLRFERWEKHGTMHSKHRVVADRVQFLTPAGSRVESGRGQGAPVPSDDIPF
jgi:single-strand DNA-binding protein